LAEVASKHSRNKAADSDPCGFLAALHADRHQW
jgi:hypothetical protein